MKKLVIAFVICVMTSVVWLTWEAVVFLNQSPGQNQDVVYFEIQPGESTYRVSERLQNKGLITDSFRFRLFMRLTKKLARVGEYALNPSMFPSEIAEEIASGKSALHSFTIQEGLNIYEIASAYESKGLGSKAEFLKWSRDPELIRELLGEDQPSLEGYLFPETYHITKYTKTKDLVRKMVDQFLDVYSSVKPPGEESISRREAVIMASVIEKETGAPEERPIISSVYWNRIKKGMRLQADPTVLYGIWVETGKYKNNLTKKDLRTSNPYNTYTESGLPKGPIANPGRKALQAAFRPATTDYYFFVSRNDGTHVFSKDYASHREAVRKYQLDRSAREGKSWRDLRKRTNEPEPASSSL